MQDRLDKLEQDYENLMEQIRIANNQRFGRSSEKLSDMVGQQTDIVYGFVLFRKKHGGTKK